MVDTTLNHRQLCFHYAIKETIDFMKESSTQHDEENVVISIEKARRVITRAYRMGRDYAWNHPEERKRPGD